jgi:multidrug efflux pump subunit AcrB
MDKMRKIKGLADLEYSQEGANPSTNIKINNELASDLGLTVQQIGNALRPFVAGDTTALPGRRWPELRRQRAAAQIQAARKCRPGRPVAGVEQAGPGRPSVMVPLRQVVEFVPAFSPQVLKRQALQRRVAVYASVEGRPGGDVDSDVQKAMKEIELPAGVRFDVGGNAQEMEESMTSAMIALGIAVIFIYLVLASQFGSFLQPVAIMMSLPLSLIGVLVALLVTGSTLNIFSVIGFIMLMGLVTKNAILLVDFTNHAQRKARARSKR